jgi:hypothetical protein
MKLQDVLLKAMAKKISWNVHRIPLETAEKVLRPYKDFDLNVRHFHEKLRDEHKTALSYTWVQQALQGTGLLAKLRERGPRRRRRPRRPVQACCCTSTGANTGAFRTTAGMTCR